MNDKTKVKKQRHNPDCPYRMALPAAAFTADGADCRFAVAAQAAGACVAAHPRLLHPWRDDYVWLCDL